MWKIHVKDPLTDYHRLAENWAEVLRILGALPDQVTGDVTIRWVNDEWRVRADV